MLSGRTLTSINAWERIKAMPAINRATTSQVLIVMGVSGCGKSTVGTQLAQRLGWAFVDADDLHSPANIERMSRGEALDDLDRQLWLQTIGYQIDSWRARTMSGVIACSALKRSYREILAHDRPEVGFVFLRGSRLLIETRLAARSGHFMPAALLQSQFDALEEPAADERAITVAIDAAPPKQVDEIIAALPRR